MIEGKREWHSRATHKIRHRCGHRGADVGAELFGGDCDKDCPITGAKTHQQSDEIKCAARQAAAAKISHHGPTGKKEKRQKHFSPRTKGLAEMAAGITAKSNAQIGKR